MERGPYAWPTLSHALCLGQTDRKLGKKLGLQSHHTTLATEVDLPERYHYYTPPSLVIRTAVFVYVYICVYTSMYSTLSCIFCSIQ